MANHRILERRRYLRHEYLSEREKHLEGKSMEYKLKQGDIRRAFTYLESGAVLLVTTSECKKKQRNDDLVADGHGLFATDRYIHR